MSDDIVLDADDSVGQALVDKFDDEAKAKMARVLAEQQYYQEKHKVEITLIKNNNVRVAIANPELVVSAYQLQEVDITALSDDKKLELRNVLQEHLSKVLDLLQSAS